MNSSLTRPGFNRAGSLLLVMATLSGAAGLGYEMVWTRSFTTALGHELTSVLAVLSAFFIGMALGAWVLHGRLSRSTYPAKWYAFFEAIIGIWALLLAYYLPTISAMAVTLLGDDPSPQRQWLIAFAVPAFSLLPATLAMGATLPALERWMSQYSSDGWVMGGVYAANTLGAALGVLLTAFLFAPEFGYLTTGLVMVAVNFSCASLALVLHHKRSDFQNLPHSTYESSRIGIPASNSRIILFTLFFTGMFGLGLEVVVVRVLSQVLENTVFTFAVLLLIYLLGTSIGAWFYHRNARNAEANVLTDRLLNLAGLATVLSAVSLYLAHPLYARIFNGLDKGYMAALTAEIILALLVFLPSTLVLGALFSHLTQGIRSRSTTIGHAMAANTLGAALAPAIFGVLLFPAVGAQMTFALIGAGYPLLFVLLNRRPSKLILASAISLLILFLLPDSLRIIDIPEGGRLVAHRDGVMASVSVVDDRFGHRHLKVNDRFQMGGTSSIYSDKREGHIPLLLHPDPENALFLGVGAGVTLASAVDHPGLKAEAVELIPEVVDLLPYFAKATGDIIEKDNLHIRVGDARRVVTTASQKYDVVVADLFHPARDGAAMLYTREHFEKVDQLLTSDGIFCQWLPLYQLNRDTLNTIIRTFLEVFPNGSAWLAHYSIDAPILGLIGGKQDIYLMPDWLTTRVKERSLYSALSSVRLHEPLALPGSFLARGERLKAFAGDGPVNTDNHPIAMFQAPSVVYESSIKPVELLHQVIHGMHAEPEDILRVSIEGGQSRAEIRLADYWAARNRFIETGSTIKQTNNPLELLANVQEPLLEVLETSPDFSPAYRPLLSLAMALDKLAPGDSKSLLSRLEQVAPNRTEATSLKQRLFD